MKKTTSNHTLTGYLPSGNGGSWYLDENNCGFLSPITISRLKIQPKIGDCITIESNENGFTEKVFVNGKLAFEEKPSQT